MKKLDPTKRPRPRPGMVTGSVPKPAIAITMRGVANAPLAHRRAAARWLREQAAYLLRLNPGEWADRVTFSLEKVIP